jgi:hypothetical protein
VESRLSSTGVRVFRPSLHVCVQVEEPVECERDVCLCAGKEEQRRLQEGDGYDQMDGDCDGVDICGNEQYLRRRCRSVGKHGGDRPLCKGPKLKVSDDRGPWIVMIPI